MTLFNTADLPDLIEALAFASIQHADQRRKDPAATPYINHPIALVHILVSEGAVHDPLVLQAALLHDVLEDTDTSAATLRKRFGAELANVVFELTDDKTLPKQDRKQLQIDRAPDLSSHARLVRLADKISNLRDLSHAPPMDWSPVRIEAYVEWARAVVVGLRGTHVVLERLFDEACGEVMRSLR
jgi:guanosine-3',5'-bis(diphosphate) 3'-pyrophosphohydrolase